MFVNQSTSINPEAFAFGQTNIKSVFHIAQLSAREVGNVLKSLPNKLSTGSDGISYQLLKEAGPGIVGPLTTLFNRSISLGQVPDEWKHAIVFPIYNGGRKDRRNPTNYRPISLTSCVARTMEKLLHCQVLEYLHDQTNGLLYEHQAGFLPNNSTVTQWCFLTHKWQMMLDKEETPCPNFWISSRPMIVCLFLAYCSNYQIWGFQEKLCAGSRLFSQTDSNVSASMEAAQIHNA